VTGQTQQFDNIGAARKAGWRSAVFWRSP